MKDPIFGFLEENHYILKEKLLHLLLQKVIALFLRGISDFKKREMKEKEFS